MAKLEITNIDNDIYMLVDQNKHNYIINIEFLDIEKKPEIGNVMYIREELLNTGYEGYSTNYTFGDLDNQYGKENILLDDIDVIKLIVDEKEIYLKRLYG